MGIREILTAPRSPWQNAYLERFIGSLRRECLDHVIVFSAPGLRRVLNAYLEYYERSRTHLSLDKDAPIPRPIVPHSAPCRGDPAGGRPSLSVRTLAAYQSCRTS